ncbi:hypothetical protein [Rhodococcus sp. LW-XY12]|uniref:hypothetical protein n=1 Tax=Rhodococcus sp. LW-XY12 TaxID=2856851 RepID=UPI001C566E86|nr:hypothetical protein [Rhodococcus sp. LW-XY12]QXU53642.1 hypothetical protein KXC42_23445 [Rhodococcus sp. LW-XY12]
MILDTQPEHRSSDRDPLRTIENVLAFSSADWARNNDTAWLYGIVLGWDDEPGVPVEDQSGAMTELAGRFQWSEERVEQLRALHTEYQRIAAEYQHRSEVERKRAGRGRIRYGDPVLTVFGDAISIEQPAVSNLAPNLEQEVLLRINPDDIGAHRDLSVYLNRADARALRDRLDAWLTDTAKETHQ